MKRDDLLELLEMGRRSIGTLIKGAIIPLAENLIDSFKTLCEDVYMNANGQIVREEFETLTKGRLVDVAKNCAVPNADGIAAFLVEGSDEVHVFLANVKEKTLLPKDKNKYVVIKADSIKKEVKEIFGENKLIILR